MNAEYVPRLLRTPDLGIFLEVQVGRKWSHVIARTSRKIYVKKLRNDWIARIAEVMPCDDIQHAAKQFLNPALGIAIVTPAARIILEGICQSST